MQRRQQPFARAIALAGMISAAMSASAGDLAKQQAMLAAIPDYASRGKGEGKTNRSARGAGMANHRAAMKARRVKSHRARSRG